jgi:hypothetical protein
LLGERAWDIKQKSECHNAKEKRGNDSRDRECRGLCFS